MRIRSKKLDQLKQKVEEKGMNWKELYQELEMSRRYVDAYRHESMESGQVPLHSHGFYPNFPTIYTGSANQNEDIATHKAKTCFSS